ncbi:putative capsid protein [Linepithema humile picorna-like virus 2]|nr:putative capsid protein [Linepithema humile picorna-like virus 2]
MIRNKLDGFTSFKATCVLKLQINAQPFQAGRLLMAAAPMPQLLGNRKNFIFSNVSNAQNVNHVQMDIAKQTEVELRIPFYSPFNSFDLIRGIYDWAEVQILVYSPLNAIDTKCMQCLLWAHFEDVEMGSPTSGKVATQQSNPELLRKKESKGIATGTLAKLGTTALNKGLELLRPATRIGDYAGELLGWTKPILSKPSMIVMSRTTESFQNVDGVDQSLVLGLSAGNAVDSYKTLMGTKADETSFDYLKRVPQFIAAFRYSSKSDVCGNGEANRLWDCAVSPSTYVPACYYCRPAGDGSKGYLEVYPLKWKQPTTLNYITAPFVYWTGSMVYTFRFVKTDYHSGRVEISYHPFVTSVDESRMEYVYKTIIDLRENAEVSITVPFISPQPWKRVSTYLDPVNTKPPDPGRTPDVVPGILYVRALTPLLCANTIIASDIEVLVEARAGDDFEVQCPITSKYLPFSIQNEDETAATKSLPAEIRVARQQSGLIPQLPYYVRFADINTRQPQKLNLISQKKNLKIVFKGQMYLTKAITAPVYGWTSMTCSLDDWPTLRERFYFSGMSGLKYETERHYRSTSDAIGPYTLDFDDMFSSSSTVDTLRFQIMIFIQDFNDEELLDINSKILPNPSAIGVQKVQIVDDQYPVVVSNQNAGNLNVKLSSDQLPLQVKLDGDTSVKLEDQPIIVKLDQSQLPLSIASKEGDVKVTLEDNTIKIDQSQLPLPTTGGGGGGGSSVVKIDPESLPIWTTPYKVAEQQSGREPQKQFGTAGVVETRTTALEGWMPPSITGMERDISRISTVNYCAGEVFSSFRQLAKRFSFCMVDGLSSSQSYYINMIELIRPGALTIRSTNDISRKAQYALYAPNTKSEVSGSNLCYTGGMYTFYRGSCRAKCWMDPRANQVDMISGHLEYAKQDDDINIVSDNIENFMTPIGYEMPKVKQIAEFQIPYYSPTLVSTIWSHGNKSQFDTPLVNLVLSMPSGNSAEKAGVKVAVAGADDIDFMLFIGPPPVLHIDELQHSGRVVHYPPSGFTPTQNVVLDPGYPEQPATEFIPVKWSDITVTGNASGDSCPDNPPPPK